MDSAFEKELTIRFSETDNSGHMKAVSIFDCFQDIGCEHAALMGLAATDLLTKNYTWIMLKYNVTIHRSPFWNEKLVIKSWRYPHKNLYELRRFDIIDQSGAVIIEGLSSWVMMDFNSRRPVRLSRFMQADRMETKKTIEYNFPKIPRVENPEIEKIFNVRMQDIDFNDHVNNSVYIGWAVESIPANILQDYKLTHVEVSYIAEIAYGNKIFSKAQSIENAENPTFLHSISGGENHMELTRMKTSWEKKPNYPFDFFPT